MTMKAKPSPGIETDHGNDRLTLAFLCKLILCLGLAWCLQGCSTPPAVQSPDDERYLAQVDATPLEFTIPLADLDVAVDRTIEWMKKYQHFEFSQSDSAAFKSSLRATNAGMVAPPMRYRVSDLGSQGYAVYFAIAGQSVTVRVLHKHDGGFGLEKTVVRRAHVLAYYIKTGELVPHLAAEVAPPGPADQPVGA